MPQWLRSHANEFKHKSYPALAPKFAELAEGQHPAALMITCADSRIDTALITNTEPGELFVVRNAGNIVPPAGAGNTGEAASIEYAVRALRIPRIVVCGHSNCGAMGAVMNPSAAEGLNCVCSWISHAQPAADELGDDVSLDALIERNVVLQIDHLRSYGFVRRAERMGELVLMGWVYDIGTGEIREYQPESDSFKAIESINTEAAE
ncbi:MAG: carbonic anhydrase [Planctomycetota bacterium]